VLGPVEVEALDELVPDVPLLEVLPLDPLDPLDPRVLVPLPLLPLPPLVLDVAPGSVSWLMRVWALCRLRAATITSSPAAIAS
jgi:hypothetical protein